MHNMETAVMFIAAVVFVTGFLCGSVPCGLWVTRHLYGIDIRKYGSGNIGTTNVFRTVGPKAALLVLLGDMFKGILPLLAVHYLTYNPTLVAVTALGALLGHNYSVFLGFKGGKGVATGLGLLLYMLPLSAAAGFAVWLVVVLLTRYVSLGSILAAVVAAASAWYFQYPAPYAVFGTIACMFVIIRHKDNIKRLINGTESKIKPGKIKEKN